MTDEQMTRGSVAGMGARSIKALESGDMDALLRGLLILCSNWFERAGWVVEARLAVSAADLAELPAEKRVFASVACDLHDIVTSTPQGRQALLNLRRKPLAKDLK